jgi:hypothetical protein
VSDQPALLALFLAVVVLFPSPTAAAEADDQR